MVKTNRHIFNEVTLWDNFKRDINWELRTLNQLSLEKRLKAFNRPPFRRIQKMLVLIGEWSYKAAVARLWNEGKLKESNFSDFAFYFWPGYDTLNGFRIFINGLKINGRPEQKNYFTGVGAVRARIKDLEQFLKYISGENSKWFDHRSRKVDMKEIFDFKEENFFYRDNPSTIAFDNVLNSLYFQNHYPDKKKEPKYKPGSTHYWKVHQKDKFGHFMMIPLKEDKSELRVLHISTGKTRQNPMGQYNILKCQVPKEAIDKAGDYISDDLSFDNIPVSFLDDDGDKHKRTFKYNYIPWPHQSRATRKSKVQIECYNYWITETLGKPNQSCSHIADNLKKMGFHFLSNRIISYQDADEYVKEKTCEVYFDHWYTLYLESSGEQADLGSLMLLSTEDLNGKDDKGDFLRSCWHWIRWVFNELRLIEAKAIQEKSDFSSIYHHQNKTFEAFNVAINNDIGLNDEQKKLFGYYIDTLSGYLELSHLLNSGKSVESYFPLEEINLSEELSHFVKLFQKLCSGDQIFSKTFGIDRAVFDEFKDMKFLQTNIDSEVTIESRLIPLRLMLKDLLDNALQNTDYAKPIVKIEAIANKKEVSLLIQNNSWPEVAELGKMKQDNFPSRQIGWRNINLIAKTLKCKIEMPKNTEDHLNDNTLFWLKIIFINGKA